MPVPTWVTNLQQRRNWITQELAEIDNIGNRTKAGSKPDFSGEAGGTQHTAYRLSLLQELAGINAALKDAADVIAAEGAIEEPEGFTIVSEIDS